MLFIKKKMYSNVMHLLRRRKRETLEKRVRSSLLPLFIRKGGKDEMTPTI